MSALPHALQVEKETLRNLAGPELFMQTGLEVMGNEALAEVHGGSIVQFLSAVVSAVSSAVGSAVISATASAIGSGLGSAVVSSAPSAASSAAASAVGSAISGASGSLGASAYYSYHSTKPPEEP